MNQTKKTLKNANSLTQQKKKKNRKTSDLTINKNRILRNDTCQ